MSNLSYFSSKHLENLKNKLFGKTIALIGLGKSNLELFKFIENLNQIADKKADRITVLTYDSAPNKDFPKSTALTLSKAQKENIDIVCISPGVNLNSNEDKILMEILDSLQQSEKVNDIELFFQIFSPRVIGVTGSLGKSTVSSMIKMILDEINVKSDLKGNIGIPIWDNIWEQINKERNSDCIDGQNSNILVLELSSVQLSLIRSLKIEVGCLTNVYPHHLNFHATTENYISTKKRLLDLSEKQILDTESMSHQLAKYFPFAAKMNKNKYDDPIFYQLGEGQFDQISIKKSEQGESEAAKYQEQVFLVSSANSDQLEQDEESEPTEFNISDIRRKNSVCAATTVCEFLNSYDNYNYFLKLCSVDFNPLPHRMETFTTFHGGSVVNDSKSTDVISTVAALRSARNRCILLCGGQLIAESIKDWDAFKDKYLISRVHTMITFGQASNHIYSRLKNVLKIIESNTLNEATRIAFNIAQDKFEYYERKDNRDYERRYEREVRPYKPVDIMLSPGCPSFDAYEKFERRGEHFIRISEHIISSLKHEKENMKFAELEKEGARGFYEIDEDEDEYY